MTDKDTAEAGLASLHAFETARESLLAALAEVEDTIARNEATRGAILEALGAERSDLPEKKASSRRTRKAPADKGEATQMSQQKKEKEAQSNDVAEQMPSGETQAMIEAETGKSGGELEEALGDWTPGDTDSEVADKKSGDSLGFEFDEVHF